MAIKDLINTKKCLFICNGGSCKKQRAEELTVSLRNEIKTMNLNDEYHTIRTLCMGRCDDGPVAFLSPDNIWFKNIASTTCEELISTIQNPSSIKNSKYFLYKMGDQSINSTSIPTIYLKPDTLNSAS